MKFPVVCLPYSWRDKVYSIDSPPFDAVRWSSFHTADQMVEMWKIVTLHLCWSDWSAAIYSSADDPKKRLWVWDQGASKPLFFRGVPFSKIWGLVWWANKHSTEYSRSGLVGLGWYLRNLAFSASRSLMPFPIFRSNMIPTKIEKMAGHIASHMWFIYYVCVFKIHNIIFL